MRPEVRFPPGFTLESLQKAHPRAAFRSGQHQVDEWLARRALQSQTKHLSATKVLLGPRGVVAGYYTLATGQVDFSDLPPEVSARLPHRALPVAVLAWLGVARTLQGQGLGARLLARALGDCLEASATFPFVAVLLDCVDDAAKAFYRRWDFNELPGHPYRLFLSTAHLRAMFKAR
jgi:GNAT superfamily N-acetyltransferase